MLNVVLLLIPKFICETCHSVRKFVWRKWRILHSSRFFGNDGEQLHCVRPSLKVFSCFHYFHRIENVSISIPINMFIFFYLHNLVFEICNLCVLYIAHRFLSFQPSTWMPSKFQFSVLSKKLFCCCCFCLLHKLR